MLEIILFLVGWLLLWSPIALILGRKLQWHFPQVPSPAQKIPLVLSLYVLAPPMLWGMARRSGQSFADFGWRWTIDFALEALIGLALAVLSLVFLWGLERLFGWIRFAIDGPALKNLAQASLPILAVAIAISTVEELLFRGFIPEALMTRFGQIDGLGSGWVVVLALGLANLVFALLHLPWDRWQTVVPQLPGLWLMGLVLSLACLQRGDLGLAIGLHAGWVWAIASLDTVQGITDTGRVPTWVTGVHGYLLAGVMGLIFLAAVGGLIWMW